MKSIKTLIIMAVFGLGFTGIVNAAEMELGSVAVVNNPVGGSDVEIISADETATGYKYYYKVQEIVDTNSFNSYVQAKYTIESSDPTTDEYTAAQSRIEEYEATFNDYIATVNGAADLSTWTESADGQISLSDLKYEEGTHHGYVLAVAAIKDGDTNVYVSRMILESTSTSTLDEIKYNSGDMASYNNNTTGAVTTTDETTNSNPETGIEDYAIYLVPLALIGGSAILFRRNYA